MKVIVDNQTMNLPDSIAKNENRLKTALGTHISWVQNAGYEFIEGNSEEEARVVLTKKPGKKG